MAEERDPLLILPRSIHEAVQREAMSTHAGSGHEVLAYMLLKQVWQDDREVLQPTITFVPHPADLAYQDGEGIEIGRAAAAKLWRRIVRADLHLFEGHTHPIDGEVDFSEPDMQSYRDTSYQLGSVDGGRVLVSAVFDHVLSLREPVFAHWLAGSRRNISVVYPEHPMRLNGKRFTRVGMNVSGIHRCPRQCWVDDVVQAGMNRPLGKWTGVLLPSPGQPTRILADTPGDRVLIRITRWPLECGCYLSARDKSSITLAELGYYDSQPWRSG